MRRAEIYHRYANIMSLNRISLHSESYLAFGRQPHKKPAALAISIDRYQLPNNCCYTVERANDKGIFLARF